MTLMRRPTRSGPGPLLAALVGLLPATAPAPAGPIDPGLRFERLGPLGEQGARQVLPVPGQQRALLVHADGRLELSAAEGLGASVLLDLGLAEAGGLLLGAAWDPDPRQPALFLTLMTAEGNFQVARLPVNGTRAAGPLVPVWEHTRRTAARERLGGGIALAPDGTLLVGIGDFGIPSRADVPGNHTGVLLRITRDGMPPEEPLEANPVAFSRVVAHGLRDPARLVAAADGAWLWLLDHGGSAGDELNALPRPMLRVEDFGWGAEEILGAGAPGTLPPVHVWPTASTDRPAGLALLDDRGLAPGRAGNPVFVSAESGRVSEWDAPEGRWRSEPMLEPEPGEPEGFVSLSAWPDGELLLLEDGGTAWRLRRPSIARLETSGRESLAPFLIRKLGDGRGVALSYERVHETLDAGLFGGGLEQLRTGVYGHGDVPAVILTGGPADGSARQLAVLAESDLPVFAGGSYYLVATPQDDGDWFQDHGDDSRGDPRPGCTRHCTPWSGSGTKVGACAPGFELAVGIHGADPTGPVALPDDLACRVFTLTFSTAWCAPSWVLSRELEPFYREHAGEGYVHVDVLFEGEDFDLAEVEDLEAWRDEHGLSFPILADEERSAFLLYDEGGGVPQTFIVDREGVVREWVLGADPDAVKETVLELLAE